MLILVGSESWSHLTRPGVWTPAYDADGRVRDGAWVAELTGMLDLTNWPRGQSPDDNSGRNMINNRHVQDLG
jgi:hypothetical protein